MALSEAGCQQTVPSKQSVGFATSACFGAAPAARFGQWAACLEESAPLGPASAAAAPLNDLNCTVPDFQNCSQFTKMNDLANSKAYAMQAQRKKRATGRPHSRPGCWSATTTAAILPPPNCPPQLAAASCMLSSAEQATRLLGTSAAEVLHLGSLAALEPQGPLQA